MPAEEAVRHAEAERLTLVKADNSSGYNGVSYISSGDRAKPYQAQLWRGGKQVHLGCFATAEEAALIIARDSSAQAAAPQPPPASSRKRKIESEE